jgi:hypothetical protein
MSEKITIAGAKDRQGPGRGVAKAKSDAKGYGFTPSPR